MKKNFILTLVISAIFLAGMAQFVSAADYNRPWVKTQKLYLNNVEITASGAELNIMDGVTATATEINAAADRSTQLVTLTGTTAITEALHEGRIVYFTGTDAAMYTLPEATGSGGVYTFIIGEVNTSGTIIITADTTNGDLTGTANLLDLDAAAQGAFGSLQVAGNDKFTWNGTTTGGQIGDTVILKDVATDVWSVVSTGLVPVGSNPATPFSGT